MSDPPSMPAAVLFPNRWMSAWVGASVGWVAAAVLTLFVATGACTAQPSALPAAPPHPGIDVQHYAFDLSLADTTNRIQGRATVRLRVRADTLSAVRLDLLAPEAVRGGPPGAGMRVVRARERHPDGSLHAVRVRQSPGHVHLQADTLRKGQTRTFVLRYAGVPADGLIIGTNRHGDRTFFGDNWPNRARHWLPVVDHLSDKATAAFRVTAPSRYRVVSNGALVSDSTTGASRVTHWKTTVPLPPKVMIIGVADFAVETAGTVDGVPVQSWVYPQDRAAGFDDLGQAPAIVRFFERKVAPYPYPKLANVQSATRYGGMENASAIFYSEKAVADGRDSEELLAHEIAHQWFGNTVTEADWPHLWLSEGVATYLTGLWLEETSGADRLRQYMRQARERVRAFARQRPDAPLVDTTYRTPMELLTPNAYQKGAWVLHMLRRTVGTQPFWTGLRTYYERYRHGNASTADFRAVMEEVTGRDLTRFFEQWTRRPGHPVLQVEWSRDADAGTCTARLEQVQESPPFAIDVDLQVQPDADARPVRHTVEMSGRTKTERFACPDAATDLQVDPGVDLLAEWSVERRP